MANTSQHEEARTLRSREAIGETWGMGRMNLPDAPTFYPTEKEFANFPQYVNRIVEDAREFGIAKVVPPASWRKTQTVPPADEWLLPGSPIRQHVTGAQGLYHIINMKSKACNYSRFAKQAATYAAKERAPAKASLDALEDKFWSEIVGAAPPLYGADLDGTLFSEDDPHRKAWNLNHLPDLLRVGEAALSSPMSGINTPMLYFGGFRTMFPLHTEDMDLFSINYLHYGLSKQWYGCPSKAATLVEMVAAQCCPESHAECKEFLRHKTTLIAPDLLVANGVPCCKLRQHAGEFVITLPRAYHFGFNCGHNCAESTNFALPSWIPFGHGASVCRCQRGSGLATIDMTRFDAIRPDHGGKRPLIKQGRVGKTCGTPGCRLPDFHDGPCTGSNTASAGKRLRGSGSGSGGNGDGSADDGADDKSASAATTPGAKKSKGRVGVEGNGGSSNAEGKRPLASKDGGDAAADEASGGAPKAPAEPKGPAISALLMNKLPAGIAPWVPFADKERYEKDLIGPDPASSRGAAAAAGPSTKARAPKPPPPAAASGQRKRPRAVADGSGPAVPKPPTRQQPPPAAKQSTRQPPPPQPPPTRNEPPARPITGAGKASSREPPARPTSLVSAARSEGGSSAAASVVVGASGVDLSSVLKPSKNSKASKAACASSSSELSSHQEEAAPPPRSNSRVLPRDAESAWANIDEQAMIRKAMRDSALDERDRRRRARDDQLNPQSS